MPWVQLAKYESKKVPLTNRDKAFHGRGYVIRKHPIVWIWYLCAVATWTVGIFGTLVALHSFGVLAPLPAFWTRVWLAVSIILVATVAVLRYRIVALEYVLITPHTFFCSEVQYWFVQVVDVIAFRDVTRPDTDEVSGLLPGVRTVSLHVTGDAADKTMHFVGGGDAITAAWQMLREHRKR